jgi:hypothetical protein
VKTPFLPVLIVAILTSVCGGAAARTAEPEVVIAVLADLQEVNKGKAIPAYEWIAAQQPQLLILAGDMDHRFVSGRPFHRAAVQRLHCEVHGRTGTDCANAKLWPAGQDWLSYLEGLPLVGVPDDHDGNGNNSDRTTPGWPIAIEEYQRFYAGDYASSSGLWRTVVSGNVRVILLDTRSQRDPRGTRNGTILGDEQEAWLDQLLATATEDWVLLVSGVPLGKGAKPWDAWSMHPKAQNRMLARMNGCSRCVIVSADQHTGGGADRHRRELTIPHLNLRVDGWGTCHNHCGTWSEGLFPGEKNPGFGIVRATEAWLRLEIWSATGRLRLAHQIDR